MATAIKNTRLGKSIVLDSFRRWGYLAASLDPLANLTPVFVPELDHDGPEAERARAVYSGALGVEFMHLPQERREWIQQRMEDRDYGLGKAASRKEDQRRILERIVRADLFEQVLQTRYLGTKRYSLEGVTALIPLLDEMLAAAIDQRAVEAVFAMSHRGRLNVMVHSVGVQFSDVFAKFEDFDPRKILGGGDVKYHLGATGDFLDHQGRKLHIHLVSNPSHLEAVDPVAIGRVRAKQTRAGENGQSGYLPILLHGDAAFAGQGIVAETLNFAGVRGFSVGGTLHVIVNNLIGFTTNPSELHSSRFAADLGKRLPIPLFHVNGENLDAVIKAARMALEYRYRFSSDVIVDLIGYRRHGHSEVDDPSITQPLLYQKIKQHPPLWQIYAQQIGEDPAKIVEEVRSELEAAQKAALESKKVPTLRQLPAYWSPYSGGRFQPAYDVETGIPAAEISALATPLSSYPAGFHIHPKVGKLLRQRGEMGSGKRPVDFAMAEMLAFASLLRQGVPLRLSGQDSRRGTFNQRHAVLIDTETEEEFVPLASLGPAQGRCEIYNSTLSEAAILGFEYGFSRDYPEALVLWEAQFGDFANGAQIIIDQFICAGEDKWGLLSGLVLLLPHGYEGQGPEHSSARIERFLQLAAEDNIQVCQPSSAAQYFHLLRRQALSPWRKPLVVFTPKGMLRHPDAASCLAEFERKGFLPVLPDPEIDNPTRVLIATGKIGHELRAARARLKDSSTAVIMLEQLYPFPEAQLAAELARHASLTEVLWVQEEPANMGAHFFVMPRLRRLASRPVRSIKRSASASPATGSSKAHELEQKTLLALAFAGRSVEPAP